MRQIEHNFSHYFSISRYPEILSLYDSGVLSFEIVSDTWEYSIIKKDGNLVFYSPHGIKNTDAEIHISLGSRKNVIPISFTDKNTDTDFSIAQDMYKLSLQERSLSCESSASSDILSTLLGKNISEEAVIYNLPKSLYYNTVPEEHPNNVSIWGNPNIWFVGHIDHREELLAKQKLMTGYGVYEAPIAQVYNTYWFTTQIINKHTYNKAMSPSIHIRYLLEKLKRWSYVQLWWDWCTRLEYDDGILDSKRNFTDKQVGLSTSAKNTCYNVDKPRELKWKYYGENGELVEHIGLDGEHAFILLGWKGSIKNPTHIRVWDTDTGYHEYPLQEWMRKWEKMDYRSIVIQKKSS